MAKIGRNNPCPCGSGQKHKHCCGNVALQPVLVPAVWATIERQAREIEATRKHQQHNFGHSRPSVSAEYRGYRLVGVGSKLHYSNKWKTFHEFLIDYLKNVMGRQWGAKQSTKPTGERHPLIGWLEQLDAYLKSKQVELAADTIKSAPMTGAVRALLSLAYNLYLIQHNVQLQYRLASRLRDPEKFWGADYELHVAGELIKAGFDLDLEDESDRTQTHCEFTATHKISGEKLSVEAKSHQPERKSTDYDLGRIGLKVSRKLRGALEKNAAHPRLIFIDLHTSIAEIENGEPIWAKAIRTEMADKERSLMVDGKPAPAAYVCVTNRPYFFDLNETETVTHGMLYGYKLPELQHLLQPIDLREALCIYDRHRVILNLMRSMTTRTAIPHRFEDDFEGIKVSDDITALALQQGEIYVLIDRYGDTLQAEFKRGEPDFFNKQIRCWFQFVNEPGLAFVDIPLRTEEVERLQSDKALLASLLANEPEKAANEFELFDWFVSAYHNAPREVLLAYLKDYPDFEVLRTAPQLVLVKTYAVSLVVSAFSQRGSSSRS